MQTRGVDQSFSDVCELTGVAGKFVKSHIIPQAFSRPTQPGRPFYQLGADGQRKRRWSSWYDAKLVTRTGEEILAGYDDWAASELRRTKLVWSGWGGNSQLGGAHKLAEGTPWGMREIVDVDGDRFRVFLLSLLWRAAATKLAEFRAVQIPSSDLVILRELVRTGNPGPVDFYPSTLTQLSTLGAIHNQAPIAELKRVPLLDSNPTKVEMVPIFRFYFDGLIVHFDRRKGIRDEVHGMQRMVVGQASSFLVTTQTFEHSYQQMQRENVQFHLPPPS